TYTPFASWVTSRWAGRHVQRLGCSSSEAAWTGCMSLATADWHARILEAHGVTHEQLPFIRPSSFYVEFTDDAPPLSSSLGRARVASDAVGPLIVGNLAAGVGLPLGGTPVPAGEYVPAKTGCVLRLLCTARGTCFAADSLRVFMPVADGAAAATAACAHAGRVVPTLTVGTSAALRCIVPAAMLQRLCACQEATPGHRSTGTVLACARCGQPRLSSTGLWVYRISEQQALLGGALTDGGNLVEYWRTLTGSKPAPAAVTSSNDVDLSLLSPEAECSEYSPTDLLVMPFWSGERSTGWRGDRRGAILGFTLGTTPAQLKQACMEAVAMRLRAIADALRELLTHMGIAVDMSQVYCNGGALVSSPRWRYIIGTCACFSQYMHTAHGICCCASCLRVNAMRCACTRAHTVQQMC
ncbi:hypothetical protein EON66_07635, partial [archaeon]